MAADKNYIKSMTSWFEEMELTIIQKENTLAFHKKEIELHRDFVAVISKTITHDKKRFAKTKKEFDKYLDDNKVGEA